MTAKKVFWHGVLLVALACLLGLPAPGAVGAQQGERVRPDPSLVPRPAPAPAPAPATASVLRLIKFSGSAANAQGQPLHGTVGVTFALYADQQGGSPLWLETQNVRLDNQGRYTALLGAMSNQGLPLDIFASGEARWLSITVQGQAEQPRVLLVAVPYALKAADAETLGGKPASAYVLSDNPTTSGTDATNETGAASSTSSTGEGSTSAVTVSGSTGYVAKFTATDAVGNSALFQDGSGNIGLGTTTPTQKLQVTAAGFSPSLVVENQSTSKSSVAGFTLQNSEATDAQTQWLFFAAKEAAGSATGTTNFQIRRRNATQTEAMTPFLITGSGDIALQAGFTTGSQTLGKVGIGTRSPSEMLDVVGNVKVSGNVTATTVSELSSRRWKENIHPLHNSLEKVLQLQGVSYDRKADGVHDIGFIAEEVGAVVPEVVQRDKSGQVEALNYGRLTALLVEAVKKQQAEIQALQKELATLKAAQSAPAGQP